MKFVHLHVHSHYSLLDGLSKVPDLVKMAKKQGSNALALTDHGVMYGIIEFYKECKKAGIKPIIGCEIYVAEGSLEDRTSIGHRVKPYHLILLAKDNEGYINLMKITTQAHLHGYYYKPRIDHNFLKEHSQGLVCLSGCLQGEVSQAILGGDLAKARKAIAWHHKVFGDDYYLEMQHHPNIPDQTKVNDQFKLFAKEFNLPLVASCDSHYLYPDDSMAHEALLCIQTGSQLSDEHRFSMKGEIFNLTDPAVMAEAFADVPEAIVNTQKIADMCNVEIELGKIILPTFDLPKGEVDYKSYLKKLVDIGTKRRFGDKPSPEVLARLKHESEIISQMRYESYFLVVEDLIRWAKNQGIVVGPGRGSGAASIVSYVLNITDINPLDYDLIFERFLNPSRISMPDFDIDFADDRRDEVIKYVVDKYGKDKVAQIVTFGTMAARASIRDGGRVMGIAYAEVDKIAKLIPLGVSLAEALKVVDELKQLYDTNLKIKDLIDLAKKLEGVIRHTSVHAAGVIIADKELINYTPLQIASKGKGEISYVTQYSMFPLEDLGLLKIDFLGLKNLTIIKNALRIIRKTRDQEIDISKLSLENKATYQLLSRGETNGVFQFESEGMRHNLQNLRPNVFGDIIAMVALYRPGPMELIPDFIDRKHGRKKIKYLHPKLEPILKETYGIAVYQEQVLRIARDLCGFSMGEADVLRKAIGKKIKKMLLEQQEKFVNGAINNGIDKKIAKQLFEFVKPFASYGFNKAHATCYALIAYRTAYLKAHFPNEFLAALLTSDQGDLDKVAKNIAEAERTNIRVLPPSVNESFTDFAVVKETGNIRFGLNVIKNVGQKVSDLIVDERQKNGVYKNIENFLDRVPKEALSKKVLESLAKAGALSEFGDNKELFENVDVMIGFVSKANRNTDVDQLGIFGNDVARKSIQSQFKKVEPSNEKERLAWEKELLGTFVSKHPLKEIMPKLKGMVRKIESLHENLDNKRVKVGGIISAIQKVNTKNNEPMLFVKLEDLTGSIEVIVFPNILRKYESLFEVDKILVIEGKINVKDVVNNEDDEIVMRSEAKIIVDLAIEVDDYLKNNFNSVGTQLNSTQQGLSQTQKPLPSNFRYYGNNVVIRLPQVFNQDKLKSLKQTLEKHNGDIQVELEIYNQGKWQRIRTKTRITRDETLEKEVLYALR